jgi:phospholipid/cholesterol/gamma-HCH transport system substrate-binding protein
METRRGEHRIPVMWWPLFLLAIIAVLVFATAASFLGTFRSSVPVTVTSERSGLVLETGAKVKMRGVDVGRVRTIEGRQGGARLLLDIEADQIRFIPANVAARINVTTVFGAKFVDIVYPEQPLAQRLQSGAVLEATNVTTEVNTVFENVVDLLEMVDPMKLNAVLTAVADAVRGRGERIGEATTALNEVLTALNARSDVFRADVRALKGLGDTYSAAAQDILAILDSASTTAATVVGQRDQLENLLLNAAGLSREGTALLGLSKDNLVTAINNLEPTTRLLQTYSPSYTCLLQGAQWIVDHSDPFGGDGRTFVVDVALLPGNDPYVFPDNLPKIAAKGGPGGEPGCGSLPDATKNFPIRQLVTDTGWGTGLDIRPNPGIGRPCWADYFPVTRAVPQEPSIRQCLPGPAVGPEPYPGAPPYGAKLYGPGGEPLWPGVPPAQADSAPPAPADSVPPGGTP